MFIMCPRHYFKYFNCRIPLNSYNENEVGTIIFILLVQDLSLRMI